jgi:glycerol transport system ATP-binding protein
VYQQFINYPHLSVYENVAFPLKQRRMPKVEIRKRVMRALSQVGLDGFENRKIQALSGGQQQRVALARSLVKEANIVLLDEPLVNLDYKLREQLREEFRNIFSAKASENSILIYSSTDPVEVMQLGGQILVMDEGRILQQASAKEVYENPNSIKVSQITNDPAMNLFEGTVADGKVIISSEIHFALPQHCQGLPQGSYTFGLRAAAISLADGGFPFTVELSEISGSETFLHLKHEHVQVVGLLDSVQNFNIGETVSAQFDTAHLYAFATDGRLKSSPYGGLK